LKALKAQYGDKRRSEIVEQAEDLQMEDLIASEDVVVTSRTPATSSRSARGLPRAAPRRARQAGGDHQGRRFHRAPVHRQYHDTMLCSPRAAGFWLKCTTSRRARAPAAQAHRESFPALREREDQRGAAVKEYDDKHFVFLATALAR